MTARLFTPTTRAHIRATTAGPVACEVNVSDEVNFPALVNFPKAFSNPAALCDFGEEP